MPPYRFRVHICPFDVDIVVFDWAWMEILHIMLDLCMQMIYTGLIVMMLDVMIHGPRYYG